MLKVDLCFPNGMIARVEKTQGISYVLVRKKEILCSETVQSVFSVTLNHNENLGKSNNLNK